MRTYEEFVKETMKQVMIGINLTENDCLVESGSLVQKVVFQFGVPRIQDNAGLFHHMEYTYRYVDECLNHLVNHGYIHMICSGKRTYCKTEKEKS